MKSFIGNAATMDSLEAKKIYDNCVNQTRKFIYGLNASDVVIGLSGGIDSALVGTMAVDALGPEHVHAILIPGPYSTEHSVEDARFSAEILGIDYKIIKINDIYDSFKQSLEEPCEKNKFAGLTSQNIQARIRMTVLMAFSNAKGWLLMNTSNKTEFYVGYSTLYGDLSGVFAPIGGLFKTQVYGLALWRNGVEQKRKPEALFPIPENTLSKPPSAELAEGQTDQDSLGLEYESLDKMLIIYEQSVIEGKKSSEIKIELQNAGFKDNKIERVLKLIESNKFKQALTPPHP